MEKKTDLRIQKTYLALSRAFFEMMGEMPFEEIRVNALCERAMIRKSTFYKHFADKYELLAFLVRQLQEQFDAQLAAKLETSDPAAYYTGLVSDVLAFLQENEPLVQSSLKSSSFSLVQELLADQLIQSVQLRLKQDQKNGFKMPASPEMMAAFFVGAILESVKRWLSSGRQIGDEALKQQLCSLLLSVYRAENQGE